MTTIWIETRECCLGNIYLSPLHPLCGNLTPRGSDSKLWREALGLLYRAEPSAHQDASGCPLAPQGAMSAPLTPQQHNTHIISLYPISNNKGDSQYKSVQQLTLSSGPKPDWNKHASVLWNNHFFYYSNNECDTLHS